VKITRRQLTTLIEQYLREQDEEDLFADEEDLGGLEDEEEDLEDEEDLGGLEGEEEEDEEEEFEGEEDDGEIVDDINLEFKSSDDADAFKVELRVEFNEIYGKVTKADGSVVDFNELSAKDPSESMRKQIKDIVLGLMMLAKDRVKDPVGIRKVRATLSKMVQMEEDPSYIDKNRGLKTLRDAVKSRFSR
jgi:hypothetical protein